MENKNAENKIAEYRAAAGAFAPLRRVLERFDGKVYNCKLEKALQEEFGETAHIYAKKTGNRIYIEFSPRGNSYRWQNIVNIEIREALPDEKRINAAIIIDNARKMREEHLRTAYELEEIGKHADEIKAQLRTLEAQVTAILRPIGYEARDLYNIRLDPFCGR